MPDDDTVFVIKVALVIILFLALMLAASFWSSSFKCERQWSRSGIESNWALWQGCVVKLPDGRWLPADRVREIDIAPRR